MTGRLGGIGVGVFAAGAVALVAGCSTPRMPEFGSAPRGLTCSAAKGHATTFGEQAARSFALANAVSEARDLKGDFVRTGFRRVSERGQNTVCEPYALTGTGSGIYRCTAAVRVCGL
jgi:hypothetical protein